MDGWQKFAEASLSSKDEFFSRFNIKGICDQDYEHAQQVWNTMEKKTLGCYHDTYLKTDVLLLADVFETFRKTHLVQSGSSTFLHHTRISMAGLIKDSR